MTDNTNTPEAEEIARLRAHSAELLADLKKAKARATELEEALQEAQGARDKAAADLKALRVDQPVAQMLERVAMPNAGELFLAQWAKEYQFADSETGVCIRDKDGEPVLIKDADGKEREAQFTEADIRAVVDKSQNKAAFDHITVASHATGGGAHGFRGGSASVSPHKGKEGNSAPAPRFGLR